MKLIRTHFLLFLILMFQFLSIDFYSQVNNSLGNKPASIDNSPETKYGCLAIDRSNGFYFGWGLAETKEEADSIAKKECAERSYGLPAPNFVWSYNGANSGDLKEIYKTQDELVSTQPGTATQY